ncbi:MAG: cbb3-type cytochrome oxidase assembly protein CcoS [Exilibacterium sp.]
MQSLYILIPIALVFVAVAIKILFWAIKSGQYEDLDTEAHRILFDEDESNPGGDKND